MHATVKTIRAFDKGCFGCQTHGGVIMLSYQTESGGPIMDLFLDEKLAKFLQKELNECMERNEKE